MKKVELYQSTQLEFEEAIKNTDIESLKIWNCKIKDFGYLNKLKNLIELEIFVFDKGELANFSELSRLKKLRLIHIPQINNLFELSKLEHLEELSLESLPSWDSSGKVLMFDSLHPIGSLKKLRKLTLMKARVQDLGLQPLENLKNLEVFETDNTFSTYDFARLSANLENTKCTFFRAYHEVEYSNCNKCGSNKVRLTGVTRGGLICPNCNNKKLKEHEEEFNRIVTSVG